MGILGEIERMVGTGERRLQITQEGIDCAKLLQLHTGHAAAGNGTLVRGAGLGYGSEAPQPIGNNIRRRAQRFLRPLRNRVLGKFQLGQANEQWVTGFRRLHRSKERHLVLRASTALAAGQFSTQVRVVDFNATTELARFFPHRHDLHQLVLHQPSGLVAHSQVALEFQRRDAVLRLTQQVHPQKPARQWQLGRVENRSAGCRGLLPAHRALPVMQSTALKGAMVRAAAFRTNKPRRPARSNQCSVTPILGSVIFHELGHRQPFLKLNFVDPHRASPFVDMRLLSGSTSSPDEPAEFRG